MKTSAKDLLQNIFTISSTDCDNYSLPLLLQDFYSIIQCNLQTVNSITLNLIDIELLEEIKNIAEYGEASVYFGKSLWDIKCMIQDDALRDHEIFVQYKGPRKLHVSSVKLPHSVIQDREYSSLRQIINAYKNHFCNLASYFYELELIDQFCTVMEPLHPTFKDEYRRILLDDRIWLHVEVTLDGLATNIHLVGQSEKWHNKLQEGLLIWDHDKNIVKNIQSVFDLSEFPHLSRKSPNIEAEESSSAELTVCSICLCEELPDIPGVPLPLCQNVTCGVYFHRNCLYQWLVACAGSRPPAFGVATGSCPTCLQAIACSET